MVGTAKALAVDCNVADGLIADCVVAEGVVVGRGVDEGNGVGVSGEEVGIGSASDLLLVSDGMLVVSDKEVGRESLIMKLKMLGCTIHATPIVKSPTKRKIVGYSCGRDGEGGCILIGSRTMVDSSVDGRGIIGDVFVCPHDEQVSSKCSK